MNIPILILFFNRKDTVEQLVEQLSVVQPSTVYLSCDGGRTSQEHQQVISLRESVQESITWDCEIKTNFSEVNLGCKQAVHRAIQWFFNSVPEGIVLEDDCIPSVPFFDYVSTMLEKYRDDKSIATIGGRNELSEFTGENITFCSKFFCWGWASWADRIIDIDVEFGYQKKIPSRILDSAGCLEARHIKGMHQLMVMNHVSSWAYSYDFVFRANEQIHVVPPFNYINNIGLNLGTHGGSDSGADIFVASNKFLSLNSEIEIPIKNNNYMHKYLWAKYGLLKLALFPWIGNIKSFKRFFR